MVGLHNFSGAWPGDHGGRGSLFSLCPERFDCSQLETRECVFSKKPDQRVSASGEQLSPLLPCRRRFRKGGPTVGASSRLSRKARPEGEC